MRHCQRCLERTTAAELTAKLDEAPLLRSVASIEKEVHIAKAIGIPWSESTLFATLAEACEMKFSNWIVLALAATFSSQLTCTVGTRKVRPPKVRKPKPIEWNNSYYAGKFLPCKKLQMFNPVEMVRAQAWATGFFRKCGPPLVVEYATKYNFPAYGQYLEVTLLKKRRCVEYY